MVKNLITTSALLLMIYASACDNIDSEDGSKSKTGITNADDDSDSRDCEGGRYDQSTGLCWQEPSASARSTWEEAVETCEALNLSGYTDWKLPSRDDFINLLGNCNDLSRHGDLGWICDTCEDSPTCSELFGSDYGCYWSADPFDEYEAWSSCFGDDEYEDEGYVTITTYDSNLFVRCVR